MKRTLKALTPLLALTACADAGTEDANQADMASANPLAAYAPTAEQKTDVVDAMQRLFDALETGDAELLGSVLDPSVIMHSTETRDGESTFGRSTAEGLAERISSSEVPLIERMWDPVVAVNGAMATLWTPYDFYIGSTFSHCGVDAATFMLGDDGWKIVGLTWTRLQPPACELHPEGPPT
jgi:hypothetical protein